MNDLFRTLLPLIAMFLGIFVIVRYYYEKLNNKIKDLEEKIKIIKEKK